MLLSSAAMHCLRSIDVGLFIKVAPMASCRITYPISHGYAEWHHACALIELNPVSDIAPDAVYSITWSCRQRMCQFRKQTTGGVSQGHASLTLRRPLGVSCLLRLGRLLPLIIIFEAMWKCVNGLLTNNYNKDIFNTIGSDLIRDYPILNAQFANHHQ